MHKVDEWNDGVTGNKIANSAIHFALVGHARVDRVNARCRAA